MLLGGVVAIVVVLKYGAEARTDGFFAAYGVYSIAVIIAQSARTTIVARLIEGESLFDRLNRFLAVGLLIALAFGIPAAALGGELAGVLTGDLGPEARRALATRCSCFGRPPRSRSSPRSVPQPSPCAANSRGWRRLRRWRRDRDRPDLRFRRRLRHRRRGARVDGWVCAHSGAHTGPASSCRLSAPSAWFRNAGHAARVVAPGGWLGRVHHGSAHLRGLGRAGRASW